MHPITRTQLLHLAREAATRAYCPYSRFHVGAALLGDAGFFFTGANVENASYGLTNCAERSAIFAAVASGMTRLRAIAVACVDSPDDAAEVTRMPCGACRQLLAEYAPDAVVWVSDSDRPERIKAFTVRKLLPGAFTFSL